MVQMIINLYLSMLHTISDGNPRWFDIRRGAVDQPWKWNNEDSEVLYFNWNPDEIKGKSQLCVVLSKQGNWDLKNCAGNLDYICEKGMYHIAA